MNHTGVTGAGSPRQAARNGETVFIAAYPARRHTGAYPSRLPVLCSPPEGGRRGEGAQSALAPYAQAVSPSTAVPAVFARAVRGLRAARPRPEITVEEVPPPSRLAPYAFALSAIV